MRILAVIVTHNRALLLERCLEHLKHQTVCPEKVLVINNASTDNTENILKKHSIEFITQKNLGSAGGWHRGIDYGLKNEFDAIWLMDDDGYPDKDALNILVNTLKNKEIACVSSVVLKEHEPDQFVFPFPKLDSKGFPVLFSIKRKVRDINELSQITFGNNLYPFAHFFNGALIRTDAIKQIGNVNTDFYLMGDEVDYFFKLKSCGTVCSSLNAKHFHPDVTKREFNIQKIYYYIKNSIILNKKYFNNAQLRNIGTIYILLYRVSLRNGFGYMLSLLFGKRSKLFYKAIFRGYSSILGKDFDC